WAGVHHGRGRPARPGPAWLLVMLAYGNAVYLLRHAGAAAGRSIQAGAALAPGVSQQAFKHTSSIRIAGVISAPVTPTTKIPIERASFGDQLRKGYRLAGRPVRVKRALEVRPRLRLRHCRYHVSFRRSIAGTLARVRSRSALMRSAP